VSRIGKLPVAIPAGVKVALEASAVRLEGPKGKLQAAVPAGVEIKIEGNEVRVECLSEERKARALHGLTRKLIANMAQGVSQGFSRVLDINGVGYRAEVKGQEIHMTLGYSHPVVFQLPPGVSASVERQIIITLSGADRQVLGEAAAKIRSFRPPEPYKGKGIKYREEVIKRKAGKAVGSAGGK
jgi:large subunit ribosomal protein L6